MEAVRFLLEIELNIRRSKVNIFPRKPGILSNRIGCSSTKFRLRPSLIRLNVGSIDQNFEGASLSLSFPSTLLSPFLSRICMCARAFSPPIPPRICFSPTITINPYHQYFPFTLFAPLIFHSAWRLSWNLVNTGKLKTSSKGLSYLNVASFSRKKFYERPYTSLLTLRVALLSHGYYTSVNFYFFPSLSLFPLLIFPFWRETMFFLSRWHFFQHLFPSIFIFVIKSPVEKKFLQPVYWNEM